MTRLNLIDPNDLCQRHLVAEYKEITQFLHIVKKRVLEGHPMDDLPEKYTLNGGHCRFFMNKGQYVLDRFDLLFETMMKRGVKADLDGYKARRQRIIDSYGTKLMGTYVPCTDEYKTAINRISERILQKPHLYPDQSRFFNAVSRYQ